jgi:hypothetical protein
MTFILSLDEGEQIGEPRHSASSRGPGIQLRALLWIPGSPAQERVRPGMTAFISF